MEGIIEDEIIGCLPACHNDKEEITCLISFLIREFISWCISFKRGEVFYEKVTYDVPPASLSGRGRSAGGNT